MFRILVCAATGPEMKVIKGQIKQCKIPDLDIDFLTTGIGNHETIYNLTKVLSVDKFDFLINIGVCGYKNNKENLIQIGRIVNATTNKEILVPIFFGFTKIESIYCSETPITNASDLEESANYVDMESRAVEFVSDKFKLPRIILKVPADRIGQETINFDREAALQNLEKNIDYKSLLEAAKNYAEINLKLLI